MTRLRLTVAWAVTLLIAGCASIEIPPSQCAEGTQALPNCPPLEAVDDPALSAWYQQRTWEPASAWDEDPITLGVEAEIPIQSARMKFLGSSQRDALYSLAAKLYMVEQADHSVDAVYYIFKDDLVGRAMLGALCDAVQRGVDVRLLVDSLGSIGIDRNLFRALYQCQLEAAFIRNPAGELTTRRARVQVILFNAVSRIFVNHNRRSHDKLMVVDGFEPQKAVVITGGRNISLSYYGITADGADNPDTYMDAELILRPDAEDTNRFNVSEASEIYFSLLAGYKNNKRLQGRVMNRRKTAYPSLERSFKEALATLQALPAMAEAMAAMPKFINNGYRPGEVRLAHELANLVNKRVITQAVANLENNPNSIMYLMGVRPDDDDKHVRVVSPYLFAARYYGPDGELLLDEAREIRAWLAEDDERSYEIITNSVLTSDNSFAQSVVDMDMAPRLLLDEDHVAIWQRTSLQSEAELATSDVWRELVDNPRLRVYELGRLDDRLLGGDTDYGKLHGKYMLTNRVGFVGTANFDYRSRLFNNEMGFFFRSDGLADDLQADFELLKSKSYLWGSPEWLQMRKRLAEQRGIKAVSVRNQRGLFKFLRATGLEWYF